MLTRVPHVLCPEATNLLPMSYPDIRSKDHSHIRKWSYAGNRFQTTARGSVRRAPSPAMFLTCLCTRKAWSLHCARGSDDIGRRASCPFGGIHSSGYATQLQYTGTISLEIRCCRSPLLAKRFRTNCKTPAPRHSDMEEGILCSNRIIPLQSSAIRCTKKFAFFDLRMTPSLI